MPSTALATRQLVDAISHCASGPITKTPNPIPEKAIPTARPRRSENQRARSTPIGTGPSPTSPAAPSTPV